MHLFVGAPPSVAPSRVAQTILLRQPRSLLLGGCL
ncbi:hypothetical protein HY061_00445 [Candidatus Azambacteria bacterium]|nr:hypothetical protein [Candidatus Azambacteria bacterium]